MSAAIELARRFLRTPLGHGAGRIGYGVALEIAGHVLHSLEPRATIFVTGSFAREDPSFAPGFSDLDLALVTPSMHIDEELAFRRAARRRLAVLRATTGVVRTLDYLESRDLPLVRLHGDAWSFDLSTRWRRVRGELQLAPDPTRSARERKLLATAKLLRRWVKAAPWLHGTSPSVSAARVAHRLLVDALRVATDSARGVSEEELEGRARRHGLVGSRRIWPDPSDAGIDASLSATAQLLDHALSEVTRDFVSADGKPRGRVRDHDDASLQQAARAARTLGFEAVLVVPRDVYCLDRIFLAVAPDAWDSRTTVERARSLVRESPRLDSAGCGWAPRPVTLSRAMARGLHLLDRGGIVVDGLLHTSSIIHGSVGALRGMPDEWSRGVLHRAELARALVSLRSRALHLADPSVADRRAAVECEAVLGPQLARGPSGVVSFDADARPTVRSERETLAGMRSVVTAVRTALEA